MQLRLETYTPAEAELISGVKQATVRNWRRAGHLPRHEGHARYNLADMLVMFVMGMLVSRGIAPEAAKDFAGHAARSVFQNAIRDPRAFSDAVRLAARDEARQIPDERLDYARELLGERFSPEVCEEMQLTKIMTDAAEQLAGIAGMRQPDWLVVWADGTLEFLHDHGDDDDENPAKSFFEVEYSRSYVRGPVMLFCLGALSLMVIERLPRPAIRLAGESS